MPKKISAKFSVLYSALKSVFKSVAARNVNLPNPVIFSAALCAFLFYSNAVRVRPSPCFSSLIPYQKTVSLGGTVASNPVKTKNGCYRVDFSADSAFSENASSSAHGIVHLLVPSDIVESLFPGRLYTSALSAGGVIFEEGMSLYVFGRMGNAESMTVTSARIKERRKNGFVSRIFEKRARSRLLFRKLMFAWGVSGGFLLALFSGAREYTEISVSEAFRNAGLSHIMALSGMHLSLFGGAAFFLARKLSTRRFADLFSLVCILFFVWFAGLSPSLLRALISSLILSLSSFLRLKRPDGLTLLSLTFLIHVSIFPSHLFEIAFMLSYSSLFGILAFSPFCKRIVSRRIVPPLASSFSASVGAFVSTVPVAFSVFGTLTPIGIIATVFVSPLVSAFLYVGLFGIVLSVLAPFLSIPFGVIISIIYGLVRKTALFFAAFPHF